MPDLDLNKIDLGSFGINEEEDRVNANMTEAVKINPDQHAKTVNLSKQSGVPEFAVQSNPEEVEHKLKLDQIDIEGMTARSPATSKLITDDFNNSVIAQEDLFDGLLEGIEETFRGMGRISTIGFETQAKGAAVFGLEHTSSQVDFIIPAGAMPIGMEFEAMRLSREMAANAGIETDEQLVAAKEETTQRLLGEITDLQKERQTLTPDDLNLVQEGVRAGIESLVNMAPGVALTILSGGGTAPLLATIGVQTFVGSYGESRSEGLTVEEARWFASIDAAIEVGTELLPTKTLETILTGKSKGLTKSALKFAVQEMGTEQLATALQTVNSFMFGLDEELENAEGAQEIINIQLRRQAVTAIATIVAGGAQITAATAVNKTINKLTQTEQEQATQGDIEQRNIDKLEKDSAKSELRKNGIESFKQFVRDADGENNTHVFIDGVQTSLFLQSKTREEIEADPALKALANASRESQVSGTDVAVPVDEFMGDIAGTEAFTELRDHMTMSEETTSPFRQEQHEVETKAYVETLMNEAQENASEYVEAQEIFTTVRDQLIDSGQVNAANASIMAQVVPAWATAQARRSGKTVQQVYIDAGLVIEGPQTGEKARLEGEQVLSQAKQSGFEGDVVAEASEWQQAVDKGLDMNTDARLQRAEEMGFDTSKVVSHITDKEFSEFKPRESINNVVGAWFNTNKANSFYEMYTSSLEGKFSIPVYVSMKNPASNDDVLEAATGLGGGYTHQELTDALISKGFDGYASNALIGEIAVFDPSQIRSVNAAFDPDFKESADLLAQSPAFREVPDLFENVKNDFLDVIEEDASIDEVMDVIGEFSADQQRLLRALNKADFLGFDFPSQAISAVFSEEIDNFEVSPGIKSALGRMVNQKFAQQPFAQSPVEDQNLVVTHNISEEGIAAAADLGGLAAPSIAVADVGKGGFTNFGGISLLADPNLLDDKTVRTFDADIYSARQPRSIDKLDRKKTRKLTDAIDTANESTGLRPIYEVQEISDLDKDSVFNYWLSTTGKSPKLKKMKTTPLSKATSGVSSGTLLESVELKDAVVKIYKEQVDSLLGDNPTEAESELILDVASDWFDVKIPEDVELRETDEGFAYFRGDKKTSDYFKSERIAPVIYRRELKDSGEFELDFTSPKQQLLRESMTEVRKIRDGFDQQKFREDLAKKHKNNKLRADFKAWMTETYSELLDKKRLFKGYTPSGDRKYAEYTLNSVVREMTRTLQGGESSNYGVASVRARFANELSTKEKVKAARGDIVTKEEMDVIREEASKKFENLLEELKQYYKYDTDGWGYGSDVAEAITEGPSEVREAFGNSKEANALIDELGKYLAGLPTEYFEAKVQRAMQFSEFDTAVVPKNASKKTIETLKNAGLKIRRYDQNVEGSRNEVVAKQSKLLFQKKPDTDVARGYYDPENSIIRLTESADLSTFLHEFAHFMYEMEASGNTDMNKSINNWYKRNAEDVAAEATKNLNGNFDALKQGERSTEEQQTITEADVVNYLDTGSTGNTDKDAAVRRAVHEQFARGFETYLMEGKAPSIELRNAFRTFARWIVDVYMRIKGNTDLNVKLDDEMRQVFDRLLATEDQIAAAESRVRVEPMFTDAAMAGKAGATEEEFSDYQQRQEKVKDIQTETLRDQLIKALTNKTRKWWKEERSDIVDEELDRLKGEQVYSTAARLKDGDIKLDHATVKEMTGEIKTDVIGRKSTRIPSKLNNITAKGQEGVHPDEAAAFFGYNSGSEMLNDLLTAPAMKETAEANADQQMVERHGDVFTDGTIERLADEAVQNEERGKLILHELKILARGTNQRSLDRQTMKDIAAERIGNLSFREIHPGKYRKAEISAAQEAARMLAEGNKESAAQAKARQALNYYLGMAATEAKNETTKIIDRMARYNKKKVREEIQKAEGGYWDQIVKILERFEFRKSVSLASVDKVNQDINTWMAERMEIDGDGLVLHNAVLNESYVTHWKNVVFSDLQGISESVKNIEHVARYANKITVLQDQVDFSKLVLNWTDHIKAISTRFATKSTRSRVDDAREASNTETLRRWASQLSKMPMVASWLDGGERAGMSHQILNQRFTDALNDKLNMMDETARPVFDAIMNRDAEALKRHNRKIFIPEINDHLMGHQILAVALNTGNAGNLRKLLLGEKWANPDDDTTVNFNNPKLQAVLEHMAKSDWQMVQMIWDQMDSLYPKLAEVHRRTTGLVPPKVEATPFDVEVGGETITVKGGYYPVKYSRKRSHKAEKNAEKADAETESMFNNTASIQASVNTGATNERTGFYDAIHLSLDVVPDHFNETIHYITHHDAVRQVNRLIRNNDVADAVTGSVGEAEFNQMKTWLNNIAKDGKQQPVKTYIDEIFQRLRFGTTLSIMGFKASTGIMQLFGVFTTASELGLGPTLKGIYTTVGKSWYMNAVRRTLGSTEDMQTAWDFASGKSKVLPHRVETMDREMRNVMERLTKPKLVSDTKLGKALSVTDKVPHLKTVQEVAMKHIILIQTYMIDLPTWIAAYDKSIAEFNDETKAVNFADLILETTQGSGATKDMSTLLQNQNKVVSTLTMFMTFFSSLGALSRDLVKGAKSGVYSPTTVAAKIMFLFALPVFFEALMRGELDAPEDGEEDDRLAKLALMTALYPIQSLPFVRDVASGSIGDFGYNPSPVFSMLEKGIAGYKQISERSFTDEDYTKSAIKNAAKLTGAVIGLPGSSQAWATGEHLYDVIEEGEELTASELVFGPERK